MEEGSIVVHRFMGEVGIVMESRYDRIYDKTTLKVFFPDLDNSKIDAVYSLSKDEFILVTPVLIQQLQERIKEEEK